MSNRTGPGTLICITMKLRVNSNKTMMMAATTAATTDDDHDHDDLSKLHTTVRHRSYLRGRAHKEMLHTKTSCITTTTATTDDDHDHDDLSKLHRTVHHWS